MKPIDILTALDAAGKPQEWGHKAHARSKGGAPCSIFDPSRGVCDCGLDVIRPALKAHLVAVSRLVAAVRWIVLNRKNFEIGDHDGIAHASLDALRAALQEVDRDA